MKTIATTWNTGRRYTQDGQIITAVFVQTGIDEAFGDLIGTIFFSDLSRGILGKYENVWMTEDDGERELQRDLMHRYDRGGYDIISGHEFAEVSK